MTLRPALLLTACLTCVCCSSHRVESPSSICTLSRDFAAYRDKIVTVKGIYYSGLRDICAARCADGPWPSFLDVMGVNDDVDWRPLYLGLDDACARAHTGERVDLWVTMVGVLKTEARHSPLGPCDRIGSGYFGYGHLGISPAQLKFIKIREVEVRPNKNSQYDYSNSCSARAL